MEEEKDILRRVSGGDSDAFRLIFLKYAPRVEAFAMKMLKNIHEAQDVSQNIFTKLWMQRSELAGVRSLNAYLFRMTRNAIFQAYRHRQVVNEYQSDFLKTNDDTTPDLEAVITTADLLEMINLRIEQMPEIQRRIFRMSRYEKKTYAEIAQETGLSAKSVQRYISLALAELRKLVEVMLVFTIFDQFDM